jgi:CBS domain containing-hemolysin-like protein
MSTVSLVLLLLLPALLVGSAFFSCSETALFGLTEAERSALRRDQRLAGRSVEALLADPRMLLITILLCNNTANLLYFVTSSILVMRADGSVVALLGLAVGSLVLLILAGEVLPKLLANSNRCRFAVLVAPGLLALHRAIAPLRLVLDRIVVTPLGRLTAPRRRPARLSCEELAALIAASGRRGTLDREEQRILQDVITLGGLRVRDVMTPRVRVAAVPLSASSADVEALCASTRFTRLPVYNGDLDRIVGLLQVKRYLLDRHRPLAEFVVPARYVPEVATLDQLLAHFRETGTETAIVVDEYGGTAGVVSLEDVVEEIVGDIDLGPVGGPREPEVLGPGRYRVAGDMSVREWAEAFGQRLVSPRVSTLGGLITSRLGRAARPRDVIGLGNVRLEVEVVDRARIASAIVELVEENGGTGPQEGEP